MKFKNILLCAAILIAISFCANAQTSGMGFSFQGYAIDPDGKAMGGTSVTVKFTLLPGTFNEEHSVITDAFGVFHAIVGNSTPAKNTEFSKLDFTKKATVYTLKVEVKKTSGGSYTTISNEFMNAVPYARVAANGVPVGTVVAYAGPETNIPEGWLLCNGAQLSVDVYTQLYSAIGNYWGGTAGVNFNVPDSRGRFLRGVDDGANLDPGRLLGTYQDDAYKIHNHGVTDPSHVHNYNDIYYSESAGAVGVPSNYGSNSSDYNNAGWQILRTSASSGTGITINNAGAQESRPKNAAVYYIIKY